METKKAYGVVTAIGAKVGEKARADPAILDQIRATTTREAFHAIVRTIAQGTLPDGLVASFFAEVVTDADWVQWRSRLLLQAKLTAEGKERAPGHEAGKGVRRG